MGGSVCSAGVPPGASGGTGSTCAGGWAAGPSALHCANTRRWRGHVGFAVMAKPRDCEQKNRDDGSGSIFYLSHRRVFGYASTRKHCAGRDSVRATALK